MGATDMGTLQAEPVGRTMHYAASIHAGPMNGLPQLGKFTQCPLQKVPQVSPSLRLSEAPV